VNLFQSGIFTLASGQTVNFKIECDALTEQDWKTLARIAAYVLPPFGNVIGVPTGGLPFAEALEEHATVGPLLVADDVLTTGGSIGKYMAKGDLGVVVFARGPCPPGVTALFTMYRAKEENDE
jgi:orotate phosphoribosyltransferase